VHRAAFTLAPSFEPISLRDDPIPVGFLKTGS
jgi:spermidine synthase